MNKYFFYKLSNNLPVLFVPTDGTSVTSIVMVKVGSRYETVKESGLAHFIEHMHFKGTEKRPSYLELNKDLDSLGAEYNAFTDKEVTGYWVKSQVASFENSSELLSDMLFHSTFPETEMPREKAVIIEEIKMYEDNPMLKLGDLLGEATFGNRPLGWNTAGSARSVSLFSHDQLISFHSRHYDPARMLLVISGNVSFAKAREVSRRYFGNTSRARRKDSVRYEKFKGFKKDLKIKKFESEQVTMAFSLPAFPHKDLRSLPLRILSVIVGEGMSSRLFTEIREKRGLCYSVSSGVDSLYDAGTFVVSAGLDKKRFEEAFKTIWEVLDNVRKNGVTQEELARAKTNVRGKFLISMEDSDSIARYWGSNLLFRDKFESPKELLGRIGRVSLNNVNVLAKQIFDRKLESLAVIGAFKNEAELRKYIS